MNCPGSKWPEGTPDTALTVEVEPDGFETRSETRWSTGSALSEILTLIGGMSASTPKEHVCWGGSCAHAHQHRLEVRDLRVSYREVLALESINFATECGRSIALIGPNGALRKARCLNLSRACCLHGKRQHHLAWPASHPQQPQDAYLPQRGTWTGSSLSQFVVSWRWAATPTWAGGAATPSMIATLCRERLGP